MTFDQIELCLLTSLKEAAKVLHMDQSNEAIRSKIQKHMAVQHRANNPESDYYGYPQVVDTYGTAESGVVIHHTNGVHTMSKYSCSGDGCTLSDHKKVKPAYVTVPDAGNKESAVVYVDGEDLKESDSDSTIEELIDLKESCFGEDGMGTVKIIAPGHGSTGYYTPEVLQEAATKGVFDNAQMFIDHATDDEEAARPEGSVLTLAAKGGKAVYKEDGVAGPGVYTLAKAYADTKDFLNQRAKDIGISIRASGVAAKTKTLVDGKLNRVVKSIDYMKSADFVTRAGAGGKLVPLLESFRESNPSVKRQPAAEDKEMKIEIDETELKTLREAAGTLPKLQLQLDRTNERFAKLDANNLAVTVLAESRLPPVAQKRLLKAVSSEHFALPLKDGNLDVTAFTEAVNKMVEDEAAYLKESGGGLKLLRNMGDGPVPDTDEDKKFKEADAKLDTEMDNLVGNLSGVKRKSA